MPRTRASILFGRRALLLLPLVLTAAPLAGAGPVGAQGAKVCKLLKPAKIEQVLEQPAERSDAEGTQVPGARSCAYDVGPGLGEPGGALVVISSFSGPVAAGVGADIETRAEPLSRGVVWDPLAEVAYVVRPRKVVGVSVAYTNSDPPAEELKPQMARLARAAAKRA